MEFSYSTSKDIIKEGLSICSQWHNEHHYYNVCSPFVEGKFPNYFCGQFKPPIIFPFFGFHWSPGVSPS